MDRSFVRVARQSSGASQTSTLETDIVQPVSGRSGHISSDAEWERGYNCFRMPGPDRELGALGEKLARARLEIALQGAAAPFSGFDDKGIDLYVQFQSNATKSTQIVGVQIKTGASFGEADGGHWRIKNISPSDIDNWSRANFPVILVWVRPGSPDEYLWTLITEDSNAAELRISRDAVISPAMRFDLLRRFARMPKRRDSVPIDLCRPPLGKGLRQQAKEFYRHELMAGNCPENPVVGPVKFSWAGWHHLTARTRRQAYIQSSLQLLPVSRWAIENPTTLVGTRRLPREVRGGWVSESRLLAFESQGLPIRFRAAADVTVVVKQQITYPVDWHSDVRISKQIRQNNVFLSVYEKDPHAQTAGTQR